MSQTIKFPGTSLEVDVTVDGIHIPAVSIVCRNEAFQNRSKPLAKQNVFTAIRRLGLTVGTTEAGDVRVNLRGHGEWSAYYTDDLGDALGTTVLMCNDHLRPAHRFELGTTYLNEERVYGFTIDGTFVYDPTTSTCGRFEVDPQAAYGVSWQEAALLQAVNVALLGYAPTAR